MADKSFSTRFKRALEDAGTSLSPTRVATEFNLRYYGKQVTVQAVRKWLDGSAVPEADKLVTLGKWLGVSPAWLLFAETTHGVREDGAGLCSHPTLCSDFDRLTRRQQEIILELVATMLKAPNS